MHENKNITIERHFVYETCFLLSLIYWFVRQNGARAPQKLWNLKRVSEKKKKSKKSGNNGNLTCTKELNLKLKETV